MKLRAWRTLLGQKQRGNKSNAVFTRIRLIASIVAGQLLAVQGGFLAGVVREPSGTVLPGAEVQIQSELTGARQTVSCDAQGKYASPELSPGTYKITIRAHGFRTAVEPGVIIHAGESRSADFVIELIPLQQEITVQSRSDESDPGENGLAIGRQSPASSLPSNGRDLHAFYAIIPGSTVTPASAGDGGQFTVNGQRPNTNTVRVDGVNGNAGLGVSILPGTYPGSSLPGMTVIGSTQDLASKEEIERVELRSSDFAPEYGDRPGAQILVETRSGSNDFHGSAFGYARPAWLDSRDWFAQQYNFPLQAASLNGYGGSFGGPLFRDRTFFFVASETENVNDAALQLMAVPSLQARAANGPYASLLNAFPLPSGPNFNANEALGMLSLEKQASVQNYSARLDQVVGRNNRLFARYNYVPSQALTKQLEVQSAGFKSASVTFGATAEWGRVIHDFRFNFSRVAESASASTTANNALQTISTPSLLDAGEGIMTFSPSSITALSIAGVGQLVSGTEEQTYQDQLEGMYMSTITRGAHNFRFGADYIRLAPRTTMSSGSWTNAIAAPGIDQMLAGDPLGLTISYGKPTLQAGQFQIGSMFAQDTFRVNDRLSVLYGLRWELTPPVGVSNATGLLAVGNWEGPGTTFQPVGTFYGLNESNWPMSFRQFAPRFGLAYRFNRPNLVLRAGAGLFYDDALGSLLYAVNLSPLNMWQYLWSAGNAGTLQEGSAVAAPALRLPRVWEWRTSLEKSFEGRSTLSLAYVGSAGRKLFRLDGNLDPLTQTLNDTYFTSYGTSDYEALQAQFTGNLTTNLYTLVSYTWGHSIDTGSLGSAVFLVPPDSSNADDRGSSNFDVRHNLNASMSYQVPSFKTTMCTACFRNWNLSSTLEARTGFPFDVTSTDRSIGLGFANTGRPDLVTGVPIWIENSAIPGGRELNPAAFAPVGEFVNGTLGRNVLTGPGLFQIDASLRRQFRLFSATSLQVSATAFNLFNRSNFANPMPYMGSPLFGQPVSMQNLMLGSGTPTTGLTPIFQSGGPRTVEINLKFSF